MRTRILAVATTLLVAVAAFALLPKLFAAAPGMAPTTTQLPFYAALGAINALAFGMGVALLAFGRPMVRRIVSASTGRVVAAHLTLAWLLLAWYPHSGLHTSNGMDTGSLLWIEYGFHVPLIGAPLVLLWAFAGRRVPEREPGVPIVGLGAPRF